MKARLLKKLLNTDRVVADYGYYVAVGSSLCHKLINVDKKTLEINYALDPFHKGRASILSEELELIWDKMHELVANGQMRSIIDEEDDLEIQLPVYTFEDGALIETITDAYGYPNTTVDGKLMHDNDYFKTREEAIEYGIKDNESSVKWANDRIAEIQKDLDKIKGLNQGYKANIFYLKSLLKITQLKPKPL